MKNNPFLFYNDAFHCVYYTWSQTTVNSFIHKTNSLVLQQRYMFQLVINPSSGCFCQFRWSCEVT